MPNHIKSPALEQTLEKMYRRRNFGIKMDLEPVRGLLERLENPHHYPAFIHVAGTNGKGSVCAMIAAVLQARGLRPGMYTSPHLLRFNERIMIEGLPVADDTLAALIERVEKADAAQSAAAGGRPVTFFEFATALAFLCFNQKKVKIAVIEAGLGGRLDATNVVTPVVSVVTRIGLDHAEYLGPKLENVAAEKAGIVKPGRPVVCGAMPPAAAAVIAAVAAGRQARLIQAEDIITLQPLRSKSDAVRRVAIAGSLQDYGVVEPALGGDYQLENIATAVAAVETFSRTTGIEFDADNVRHGLNNVNWPARMQLLNHDPPMLLDGAHNPDGAAAALRSVVSAWKKRPLAVVVGVCADKDYRNMLRIFHRRARRCWTVPFTSPRALPPSELAAAARQCGGWEVTATALPAALRAANNWAKSRNGVVLIAGSLFLAADVLALADNAGLEKLWMKSPSV